LALDKHHHETTVLGSNDFNAPACSLKAFQNSVLAKLVSLGVREPEKSIKEGGVGADLLSRTSAQFYYSSIRRGKCPATVSVVGSMVAQETIKAVSQIHTPISQFMMFESLDSLPDLLEQERSFTSDTSRWKGNAGGGDGHVRRVYGKAIADELAQLKVFIVGSGAIGCELMKTFALMGIGEGPSKPRSSKYLTTDDTVVEESINADVGIDADAADDANDTEEEDDESGSPLLKAMSHGGITVTDMDCIERSNLNRQLLFR
jgi:ThiF family